MPSPSAESFGLPHLKSLPTTRTHGLHSLVIAEAKALAEILLKFSEKSIIVKELIENDETYSSLSLRVSRLPVFLFLGFELNVMHMLSYPLL